MDKSGGGAGFLRELRFPLPIYIPQSSSLSPEAGTIGQEWPRSANSLTKIKTTKLIKLFVLNLSNACHHSVQNLLASRLLSKNIKN
jgi:hypothetical protein